jgi:hypothetical protein
LNFPYICIVDEDERLSTVGSGKYLSGAPKISPCPERKKEVANGDVENVKM